MCQVKQYATEWERLANIKFDWVTSGEADIRISFSADNTCWSYIGSGSKRISDCQASMNMSISDEIDPVTIRVVVLHELGHAIGFVHEFPSTIAEAVWDRPKVYAYYAEKLKWSHVAVNRRVLSKTALEDADYRGFDEDSIMQYWLPGSFTNGGFTLSSNVNISDKDELVAREAYPDSNLCAVGSVDLSVKISRSHQSYGKTDEALYVLVSPVSMASATLIGLNKLGVENTDDRAYISGWIKAVALDGPSSSIKMESSLWVINNRELPPLSVGVSWLRLNDCSFIQHGTFHTSTVSVLRQSFTDYQSVVRTRITFRQTFLTSPKIFVGFTGIDILPHRVQVQAFTSEVDLNGFTLNVVQLDPSERPYGAQVQWIAFASNHPWLSAGKFIGNFKEGFKGVVEFDRSFKKNPKVFTAISRAIVVNYSHKMIQLDVGNIEPHRMKWEFTSIGNWETEFEANYLAIDL